MKPSLSPRDDGSDEHSTGAAKQRCNEISGVCTSPDACAEVGRCQQTGENAAYLAAERVIESLRNALTDARICLVNYMDRQYGNKVLSAIDRIDAALEQEGLADAEEQVRAQRANTSPALQAEVERLREVNAKLAAALEECADYIEQVSTIDPDDDPCAWPLVDGATWCSALCKEHGCAKARTSLARAALKRSTEV